MNRYWSRREFLASAAGTALLAPAVLAQEPRKVADFTLTVIGGKPRERGRQYGDKFKDAIRLFLEREIYATFVNKPASKDEMYRYADRCGQVVKRHTPIIFEELEGMAEGAGLRVEEALLLSLHEELFHRQPLPGPGHCMVLAAGPPDTSDGNAYVGQTWDWMASVHGLSNMLRWERPEGPSLLT